MRGCPGRGSLYMVLHIHFSISIKMSEGMNVIEVTYRCRIVADTMRCRFGRFVVVVVDGGGGVGVIRLGCCCCCRTFGRRNRIARWRREGLGGWLGGGGWGLR